MNSKPLWLFLGVLLNGFWGYSQQIVILDSVVSNRNVAVHEFYLNFPVGQTFIQASNSEGMSGIRAILPNREVIPFIQSDSFPGIYRTSFALQAHNNEAVTTEVKQTSDGTVYNYQFSRTTSFTDPSQYLWELNADPFTPIALDVHAGFGSSRMDLSGMTVKKMNVRSGASDVIVTYSSPNRTTMEEMYISAGMSKIVVRNLELAKAKTVLIENGMGNTRIVLGNNCQASGSQVNIQVGAGSCDLIIHESMPVRIILNENFFSSTSIPGNFLQTSGNIYVNPKYESHPENAVSFFVDLGLGRLNVVSVSQ